MASAPLPHSSAGWKTKRTVPSKPPSSASSLGRPEQHGRVAVMAAGVHDAGILRAIGLVSLLGDAQGIHVRPERDRPIAAAAFQRADDARAADAFDDLVEAEFPQLWRRRRPLCASPRSRTRDGRADRAARQSFLAWSACRSMVMRLSFRCESANDVEQDIGSRDEIRHRRCVRADYG